MEDDEDDVVAAVSTKATGICILGAACEAMTAPNDKQIQPPTTGSDNMAGGLVQIVSAGGMLVFRIE